MALIKTVDLIKVYKLGKTEVTALRNLSLTIDEGEIVSLMGPSGCGKTTLLNQLGGIDRPTSGEVFSCGFNLGELSRRRLVDYRRNNVGFVFQFHNLNPHLSAKQNIMVPLIFGQLGREERKRRADELLDAVHLSDRANHHPDALSGGERQRIAVAVAIANNPTLILADEPTGELDTAASREICDLLVSLNKDEGMTVFLVTHDPDVAKIASRRVLKMQDGHIIGEISPQSLDLGVEGVSGTQILVPPELGFPPNFCSRCGSQEIVVQESSESGVWFQSAGDQLALRVRLARCVKCSDLKWGLEEFKKAPGVEISHCRDCGNKVRSDHSFCSSCGIGLSPMR